ncbi:hypothetical protein [Geotalea toluenoxydans]|uniref:hypothetical protein n=1 Tax=Geotalea toluenoxydans TaxID=421624 RepID=UPI0006D15366|nr:hypothetical protein [Geotalea toluenoxydans]
MFSPVTIPKRKPGEEFDHRHLFEIGLQHVQRLSHRIWTDYNIHDPGITILELLAYALTDLSYRASLPVKDLLAAPADNEKNMQGQFFTARTILPNRPLTLLDYRKLLIDLKGVRNAWLEKCPVTYYADIAAGELSHSRPAHHGREVAVQGLYNVIVDFESNDPQEQKEAEELVRKTLHGNRNLCEDFVSIMKVETEEFNLCCEIEVAPDTSDAGLIEVAAKILFMVEQYFDPPVRNYSLSEMLEKKKPDGSRFRVDELFEGPRLDCGFIDDYELAKGALREEIRLSDIISIVMDVDAVRAVQEILVNRVRKGKVEPARNKWVLKVSQGRKPVLGKNRIVFNRRGVRVAPSEDAVRARLAELRKGAILLVETKREEDLDVPLGIFRNPSTYYSFQNHFPQIYGISEYGLGSQADDRRKASAMQLKGYLLFFDQLMADYLAQLGRVRELFSNKPHVRTTYFHQVVDSFAQHERLYSIKRTIKKTASGEEDKKEKIRKIVAFVCGTTADEGAVRDAEKAAARFVRGGTGEEDHLQRLMNIALQSRFEDEGVNIDRRSRFLDHLIARFAERFTEFAHLMYSDFGASSLSILRYKCEFLKDYPRISSDRGLAYNYTLSHPRSRWDSKNISGFERRVARLLGIRNFTRRNLAESIPYDIYPEIDATPGDEFRFRIRRSATKGILLSSSRNFGTEEKARQEMMHAAHFAQIPSAYVRSITTDGKHCFKIVDEHRKVVAVRKQSFGRKEEMEQAIDELIDIMTANYGGEGMYVVENILLRPQDGSDDPFLRINRSSAGDDVASLDPYSYRLHVILPAYGRRFGDMHFRRYAEQVIRQETPAHILPKICWISREDMELLQEVYQDWVGVKSGADESDRRSKLFRFFCTLFAVKNIYPTATLTGCAKGAREGKFILDQTSLGKKSG